MAQTIKFLNDIYYSALNSTGATANTSLCLQTSTGRVGIGTTSPFTPLHVSTTQSAANASGNMTNGFAVSEGGGGPAMNMGIVNSGATYYGWIQSAFINNAGVTNPLILNPLGGNVGINSSSPAYTLDVNNGTVNLAGLRVSGGVGGNSTGYGAYLRGSGTSGSVGWGAMQEFYYTAGTIPTGSWTNIVAQSTLGTNGVKNAFVHVRMFGAWWGTIQTIADSGYAGYPTFVSNSPCYQSGFEVRFSGGYLQILQNSGGNAGMDIIITKIGW
jgi:hypothetical protein